MSLLRSDADPCTADSCDPTAGCVFQPSAGLEAVTCLLTPDASCQPMPPTIAEAIAQAQSRIASSGATQHQGRAKKILGHASHILKRAAKNATRLAKKRLAPACSAALSEASSRIAQLEKTR